MISRSIIFNKLRQNLTEIGVDHSKQRRVLKIGFCLKHVVITLLLILKHTQSMRRWILDFDYIVMLYGAVFDIADVTENGVLFWNIQFSFCVFCPLAIVIQEIHRKDCFNKRKQETGMG